MNKILIIAGNDKGIEQMCELLKGKKYSHNDIFAVTDYVEALKILSHNNVKDEMPELIIINVLPGEIYHSRIGIEAVRNTTAFVLLILPEDQYRNIRKKTEEFGILTIKSPIDKNEFEITVDMSKIYVNRIRMLKNKNDKLDAKVAEYKIVNRAKWALIENLHFTEEQAHKYIEKQAMDLRTSRKEIADNILKTYYIKNRDGNENKGL